MELLQAALLDLILLELLQVVREAELLPRPDHPLCGVVLVPLDGVTVIRGELVVEVVVALSERDKSRDDMIARRVSVVEGLVTEPVGQGVDAEGGLLHEENAQDAGVDEATPPISPAEPSDEAGEDHAHEDDRLQIVAVLPDDDGVIVQVGDVGAANALGVLLHDHPAEVGIEETLADGIWVFIGVSVAMVGAMVSGPPADGALDGAAAHSSEEDLQRHSRRVGGMSPEAVIACRDAHSGHEVVNDGPEGGLPVQGRPVGGDAPIEGNADDEDDIEPVDVLIPVLACHRQVGDVWFLGVMLGRDGGRGSSGGRRLLGVWRGRSHGDGEGREERRGEEKRGGRGKMSPIEFDGMKLCWRKGREEK